MQYLKYENAGDELVGCTLTGISPVCFKQPTENSNDIDEFARLVFSIEHSVPISLSHVLLVRFIFNEKWTIEMIPPTYLLAQSLYLTLCEYYPNRFILLKQAYHGKMILTVQL